MIIFAKADGQVIQTQPTPIYQGSSLKGSVYLVAPFPNSNGVTIQFQLPNGNVTKAYPMTPTGEIEGVKLDNAEMSIWCWDVKNSMVTAIPGVVGVTIKVYEASPNITYYGPFSTLNAIENIPNPQTNAYAYCIANGKVYKYNGTAWEEGVITISSIDYLATAITTSFPVIKGVPNAKPPSEPDVNEWKAIISALGSIGGKVAKPLMTNFTYDPTSGESVKHFNSGMTMAENFPSVYPGGATEYNGFAVVNFVASAWQEQAVNDYILYVPFPTVNLGNTTTAELDISVYELTNTGYTKRYPNIHIGFAGSNPDISIDATIPYDGVVLITKKASLITPILLDEINEATANANTATTRANTIAHTLETAYNNGDFKGEQGDQGPIGPIGPQGPRGVGVPEGGTVGQVLTKTADGTAWEDAKPSLLYMGGEGSYGGYDIYFKLPTAGAKKITVVYTSQYNSNLYQSEYLNENVVVWENGQPISGLEFTLLAETYTEDNKVQVPLRWTNNDTTLDFAFYEANNQSYYSGVSMTALFKIEY